MSRKGKVKFFEKQRGFGFITPENGEADVFVHISAIQRSKCNDLAEGDTVEFDTEMNDRKGKYEAVNIRRVA